MAKMQRSCSLSHETEAAFQAASANNRIAEVESAKPHPDLD